MISSDEKSKSDEIKPEIPAVKKQASSLDNALYEQLESTRALALK